MACESELTILEGKIQEAKDKLDEVSAALDAYVKCLGSQTPPPSP